MAGKIVIDTERCKGCGLCVSVCPKHGIIISDKSNVKGYFPAEFKCDDCTSCAACAIICPEAVIEVYAEERKILSLDKNKKSKTTLSQSKP